MRAPGSGLLDRVFRRPLAIAAVAVVALSGAVTAESITAPAAQAAELTYTHEDGATITYDSEVVAGEPIRLSGTGWVTKSGHDGVQQGNEGSITGVKFMPGSGQSTVVRTQRVENPATGEVDYDSPDVWDIIQASGTGDWWDLPLGEWVQEIPWPTAENATNPPELEAGDTFSLQFLSGTLYNGGRCSTSDCESERPDVSRTVKLNFTVVDDAAGELAVAQQPETQTVASGAEATFTAAASGGTAPVTVRWQRSTTLSGSSAPTSFADIAAADAVGGSEQSDALVVSAGSGQNTNNRWYRAVYTDGSGRSVTTAAARLSIVAAPKVVTQPVGQTISAGGTATFTAAATSDIDYTTRWQSTATALANGEPDASTWTDVAGGTAATLSVAGTDAAAQHGTFYRAVFTNASGEKASEAAQLRFSEYLDTSDPVTVSDVAQDSDVAYSVSAPNAVVKGEPIVIEGTGYLHPDGGGSVANFMVDASYSGDPNTLKSTRTIVNPATGEVFADARSHGLVQAGADGTWRMEIPWPDETNTDRDAAFFAQNWSAGSQHMVRILTGSMLTGDRQRGITVRFTVVDEATATEPVAPRITQQPQDASVMVRKSARFTASAAGTPAPTVQWQSSSDGAAWVDISGATSSTLTLAKVSAAQSGNRYRAVFTNSEGASVSNAATLTVTPDVLPDGKISLSDSRVAQYDDLWFSLSDFDAEREVTVELVNAAGETIVSAPFVIGADGNTLNPDGQTYRRLTVPRKAEPGGDYRVIVRDAASKKQIVASEQLTVERAELKVYNPGDHAGGVEDLVVPQGGTWTFRAVAFTPKGKLSATAVIDGKTTVLSGIGQISTSDRSWQLDDNGDTTRASYTRIQIPSDVQAGPLEVTFTDGKQTVKRTLTVEAVDEATVTVAESAELGGTLHVTGRGFNHPDGSGSRAAIKINDGAYSRLDTSVHQNTTIWYIVEADDNGEFEIDMPIPNGTTADDPEAGTFGSSPALEPGDGYSLRFLTGNLKDGDASRNPQSASFTITGAEKEFPFTDVDRSSVHFTAIDWLYQTGLTTGTSADKYSPKKSVNRAQMALYLYRLAGEPKVTLPAKSPFPDVKTTDTSYRAIVWMVDEGLTNGVKKNGALIYDKSGTVTRGQMAAFLYRYSESPEYTAPKKSPIDDVPTTNVFYREINWLADTGITTPYTNSSGKVLFRPKNDVLREQMASFLYRLEVEPANAG